MFVSALQTEVFDTGYCWIVYLSFLTSHNLLFFRFYKTSKKTTFSVFLSFFLVKLSKSQSLKLNISRTAQPILMILVSFCRILNGLLDEINLFWRCSSPLTLSDPAFSVVRKARGEGSEARMPKINVNINWLKWNFAWVIMIIRAFLVQNLSLAALLVLEIGRHKVSLRRLDKSSNSVIYPRKRV